MTASDARRAIEAVWRIESPRLIAGLARIVRDVGLAEELAQDALVAALERWPETGVPTIRAPGSWPPRSTAPSTSCAAQAARAQARGARPRARGASRSGRARSRRGARRRRRRRPAAPRSSSPAIRSSRPRRASRSRCACSAASRPTRSRARSSSPEPTIAQRIVRAKRTLAEARVPFEVPRGDELAARLASVLEVIYLIFNEGYAATAGDDWMRPALCEDALRLGRILAELAPRRAGGPRPRRADGDPGVARRARASARRASRSCCSTRTARAGTTCSSAAASRRSSAPRRSAARSARTRCRPRSPPATRARAYRDGDRLGAHRGALRRARPR